MQEFGGSNSHRGVKNDPSICSGVGKCSYIDSISIYRNAARYSEALATK